MKNEVRGRVLCFPSAAEYLCRVNILRVHRTGLNFIYIPHPWSVVSQVAWHGRAHGRAPGSRVPPPHSIYYHRLAHTFTYVHTCSYLRR